MAFVELKNNDGTPFKTEAEKAFAAQPPRSDADMAIERVLNDDSSVAAVAILAVVALAFILAVGVWIGKRSK